MGSKGATALPHQFFGVLPPQTVQFLGPFFFFWFTFSFFLKGVFKPATAFFDVEVHFPVHRDVCSLPQFV